MHRSKQHTGSHAQTHRHHVLGFLPYACLSWTYCTQIVGYEGLFGVIGTLGIMAPIAYFLPGAMIIY